MADWVLVVWITVHSGSLTTQKVTAAQCKAAIAMYDLAADPIMAYCFGPRGQSIKTSNILDRLRRFAPPAPALPPQLSRRPGQEM